MTARQTNISNKTRTLVMLALFSAIIILMGFTPWLGFLKFGVISITLIVIPVAIGAIMLGPTGGAILGAVFGMVSFIQCFGMDDFGVFLLSLNPIKTFIMCMIPRILVGYLTGLIFNVLSKRLGRGRLTISSVTAAICCPLMNTVFFVGLLVALFGNAPAVLEAFGATNIWGIILAIIGVNAVIELAVTFVVSAGVSRALLHFLVRRDS